MKKSLLAFALALSTGSSLTNAATVYDKDGTTFAIGGRVQSVFFSANQNKAGQKDASLVNSSRLNLYGRTKINDYVSALAFTEWDLADGHARNFDNSIKAREQYVGADFGEFGKLTAGKGYDSTRAVTAVTDTFETLDIQNITGLNGDRRSGLIRYDLSNGGLFLSLSGQIAADEQPVFGVKRDIEKGYGAVAGYTFDDLIFGPLSFKAGFIRLDGQDDNSAVGHKRIDKATEYAYSFDWGDASSGLYLAAVYYVQKTDFDSNSDIKDSITDAQLNTFKDRKLYVKRRAYETLAGYSFDSGIALFGGYQVHQLSSDALGESDHKFNYRRIPVQVKYTYQNVKLWVEADFDAGSDKAKDDRYSAKNLAYADGEFVTNPDENFFTVGARYSF
ncbi:MAG: porin [Succinivibrio sp.]